MADATSPVSTLVCLSTHSHGLHVVTIVEQHKLAKRCKSTQARLEQTANRINTKKVIVYSIHKTLTTTTKANTHQHREKTAEC